MNDDLCFLSAIGADGLPIGLQLVGRFRGDTELLRVSALFEAAQNSLDRWPGDPAMQYPSAGTNPVPSRKNLKGNFTGTRA